MNDRKKGAGEKRKLRVKWKSHLSFLLPEERSRKGGRGAIGPIHQVRGGRSARCNMRLQWLWLARCVKANQYPFLRFLEAASKPKQLFLFNFTSVLFAFNLSVLAWLECSVVQQSICSLHKDNRLLPDGLNGCIWVRVLWLHPSNVLRNLASVLARFSQRYEQKLFQPRLQNVYSEFSNLGIVLQIFTEEHNFYIHETFFSWILGTLFIYS